MRTVAVLKGAHGLVVMALDEPDKIIAVRIGNAGGVVIGYGDGGNVHCIGCTCLDRTYPEGFLPGIAPDGYCQQKSGVEFMDLQGKQAFHLPVNQIAWDPVAAEKGEYRHFMQKEIHEQVRSLTDTVAGRVDLEKGLINLDQLNATTEETCTD